MFLRANKRFKDGKTHRYWSVVENRRVAGGRTVQKTLLYLGEINDSDRASWTRAIEAVDERDETRQIDLFPEDRTPDPLLKHPTLKLRLDQIELARPRQWGGCWLALELWNSLVLARSLPRRCKESAMRRKKLKAYWARLKELQKREKLTRDELLLAIGGAKQKAGRNAHRLVTLHLPAPRERVTTETFRIELDRKKLRATRHRRTRVADEALHQARENPPSHTQPTRLHPAPTAPARNQKSKSCGVDLLRKRT